jgi:hypothetical protein
MRRRRGGCPRDKADCLDLSSAESAGGRALGTSVVCAYYVQLTCQEAGEQPIPVQLNRAGLAPGRWPPMTLGRTRNLRSDAGHHVAIPNVLAGARTV